MTSKRLFVSFTAGIVGGIDCGVAALADKASLCNFKDGCKARGIQCEQISQDDARKLLEGCDEGIGAGVYLADRQRPYTNPVRARAAQAKLASVATIAGFIKVPTEPVELEAA